LQILSRAASALEQRDERERIGAARRSRSEGVIYPRSALAASARHLPAALYRAIMTAQRAIEVY